MNPRLSSHTLSAPKQTINFRSKTALVWCSQKFDARNKRKMHTACKPHLAHHSPHHASACIQPTHAPPRQPPP